MPGLGIEDFRVTADIAYESVDVPDSVIDLLTSLRMHLQDKAEPPVYVSDRRFMKSVQLLQVGGWRGCGVVQCACGCQFRPGGAQELLGRGRGGG